MNCVFRNCRVWLLPVLVLLSQRGAVAQTGDTAATLRLGRLDSASVSPEQAASTETSAGVVELPGNLLSWPPAPAPAATAPKPGSNAGTSAPAAECTSLPPHLPSYELDITLDTACRQAQVLQTVSWTNPTFCATDQMVFHVYPRHKPDEKLLETYQRTVESLRLDPRDAIDAQGRRLHVEAIHSGGQPLSFCFDANVDTLLYVQLPRSVGPGETIKVTLQWRLDIPPVMGRTGQWEGVTSLLNWYPILAVYNEHGWDNAAFVGWHQPWHNEAANYWVTLRVPVDQTVASSGSVVAEHQDSNGWKIVTLQGFGIRDFAIVTSPRYQVWEAEVDGIRVQVMAFPEHQYYAEKCLVTAVECLAQYSSWFGPYPHREFKIAESYFGWNGNETSGMILIDERIFDAPKVAWSYVEHLISHELMHQWWYSTVGTDGYRQAWMDEALVTYLTGWRMRQKYGEDYRITDWPKELAWLPTIHHQTLAHNGYYLYRARGGNGVSLAPLPDMHHVHNVFFLVYDRGGQVVSMLHQRLGTEEFFCFLRHVYCKYKYRILRVEDFHAELEAFTGRDWDQFFHQWLLTPGISDWKIKDVETQKHGDEHLTTVRVEQRGEIHEPAQLAHGPDKKGSHPGRVPLVPELGDYTTDDAAVFRRGPSEWDVIFASDHAPDQIVIDPEHWTLDANMVDNAWKKWPEVTLTPFYTPLDEVPLVRPLDRWSIRAGPGVDEWGRFVLRASLMEVYKFRLSPYLAYSPQDNDNRLAAGADGIIDNVIPHVSLGGRYEHHVESDLYDDPKDQGKVFLRWNKVYTTALIYPNLNYVEAYYRFGDNFFLDPSVRPPHVPGAIDYRDIHAVGLTYHADTQMPYWNPYTGWAFDTTYEHGALASDSSEDYDRIWAQFSAVQRLPFESGRLANTKLVGRVAGGVGSPDNGEHFRLGGSTRVRGQRTEDNEGSKFWLASSELRFPLTAVDYPIVDNLANLRSLHGSVFYDVGEMYLFDDSLGIDHTVGAGLYFDVPVLSLIETLTLRLEYGYSLTNDTSVLWFGLYHAFQRPRTGI